MDEGDVSNSPFQVICPPPTSQLTETLLIEIEHLNGTTIDLNALNPPIRAPLSSQLTETLQIGIESFNGSTSISMYLAH